MAIVVVVVAAAAAVVDDGGGGGDGDDSITSAPADATGSDCFVASVSAEVAAVMAVVAIVDGGGGSILVYFECILRVWSEIVP